MPIALYPASATPLPAPPAWLSRLPGGSLARRVLAPTQRIVLHAGQPRTSPSPILTAITANLWHDWPRHRRAIERLESFARLVETSQANLLLLQEVWRTPRLDVAAWLAERLGMHTAYLRANGHYEAIGFEEGVAVLSRFPLHPAASRQWSDGPFARRVALAVHLHTSWGIWLAVSTHLSLLRRRNTAQMLDLQRWAFDQAAGRPALIGGDFNAQETHRGVRHLARAWVDVLRQHQPHGQAATHEIRWPWGAPLHAARLDYLFLLPGKHRPRVHHAAVLESSHSDHRPVIASMSP